MWIDRRRILYLMEWTPGTQFAVQGARCDGDGRRDSRCGRRLVFKKQAGTHYSHP